MSLLSQLVAQLSALWQRRPNVVHWSAVGFIALIALLIVSGTQGRARAAAAEWGESVTVLVATEHLPAGTEAADAAVTLTSVPSHLVPASALTRSEELLTLARPVPAGAVLTQLDITPAASVTPGRVGIGITVPPQSPEVETGTQVALFVYAEIDPYDPSATRTHGAEISAVVLAAEPESWFVEIDLADVTTVAQASASGIIIPVVIGPTVAESSGTPAGNER